MIPDQFVSRLWYRKRNSAIGTLEREARIYRRRVEGVLVGVLIDPLGCRCRPMTRVDVDSVACVFAEERFVAFGELFRILRHVCLGDLDQRLLRSKEIRAWIAALIARWQGGEAAIPGWDAAVRVARALSAQWCQRRLELGGLFG